MPSFTPPPPALAYAVILLSTALSFLVFGGLTRIRSLLFTTDHAPSLSPRLRVAPLPMAIGVSLLALSAWLSPSLLPGTALAVGLILTSLSGQKPAVLWGLRRTAPLRDLSLSLSTLLTFFLPILFLLLLGSGLYLLLGLPLTPQPALLKFLQARDASTLAPFLVYALVIAPLWEELFFRGTLFPWLSDRLPSSQAQWLSALAFGAVHLHGPTLIPLTLLGAILAGLYRQTHSLVPSVLLHSIFNLNTCIFLLLARPALS